MTEFIGNETGRVLLLHLTVGDDVRQCIEDACKKNGIQTGVVTSGIGSMRKIYYHYTAATTEKPEDVYETVEKPMELVSLQGIVLEGEPHLHMLATEGGHNVYSGHMELGCEVQYLVEISVTEVKDMPLGRRAGEYATVTHFEWLDGRKQ